MMYNYTIKSKGDMSMQAGYIIKLLNKENVESLKLYLVDGKRIKVESVDDEFPSVPTLEVLSPERYIVNLAYVTSIKVNNKDDYSDGLEVMNNVNF